ncbi:MAG: phage tail protein [Methanophagales archaeon ANME-1-THS]|nr:MAG: phage tail protein [Methanophagales archaeon ANME-1-THS]
MPVGERKDPYLSFRFLVEIQGLIVGGFSEVSGLQAETEIEEIREGGVNEYVHKLPKITKYPTITLKRGLTDSDVLWRWHQEVVSGKITRKSGFIILLDSEGNETWRWHFIDAYPVKWTGPDLKADSTTVAVETLELAHNGLRKA